MDMHLSCRSGFGLFWYSGPLVCNIAQAIARVRRRKTAVFEMQGQARAQYLGMGLCHIVKAVSFLNNDCKLVGACRRAL